MSNFKILKTQKGNDKLYVDGYTFYLKTESIDKDIKRWECTYRSHIKGDPMKSCRVKCVTDFQVTRLTTEPDYHYHDFNCLAAEKDEFNLKLMQGGTENQANSGIIINDALCQFDAELHGYLPSKAACYAKIRRARQKAGHLVKEINTTEDLREEYRNTIGSQPRKFLQTIVKANDAHALIFATSESIESLFESKIWYADGIYKTTDKPYLQVYVVHGSLKGDNEHKVKPLVYCIMSHKKTELYNEIFKFIKNYGADKQLELKTKFAMIDFEIAVKNSIETVFENQINVFGCSFHLKMNLRKKAMELDKRIFNSSKNQLDFNKIFALIYLPPERLNKVFALLGAYLEDNESPLLDLLLWFERTYISEGSRFNKWWNVYTLIENKLPTNNNFAESFFSSFRKLLDGTRSTLYNVIEKLRKVQITVDGEMFNINEGIAFPKGQYLKRVEQIWAVLEGYRHDDLMLLSKLSKTCEPLKNTGDWSSLSGPRQRPFMNIVESATTATTVINDNSLEVPGPSTQSVNVQASEIPEQNTQSIGYDHSDSSTGSIENMLSDVSDTGIYQEMMFDGAHAIVTDSNSISMDITPSSTPKIVSSKRCRGRPRKHKIQTIEYKGPKRKRGRPRNSSKFEYENFVNEDTD